MADKEIPDIATASGGAVAPEAGDQVAIYRDPNTRIAILGSAAGKDVGTSSGTVADGDDSRFTLLRRRSANSLANEAKALAGYRRFLDTVAFGFKASGDLDGTSTGCSVDTGLGCVKPDQVSVAGSTAGPGGGSGGGAYNTGTGNSSGDGGGPSNGYGGGSGGGGGASGSGAGVGKVGKQGLIVISYTPSGGSLKVQLLTSGTSWTVPLDWNNASNSIETIGGGGGSGNGALGSAGSTVGGSGGGGGGGAYSGITNLTLTPGASVTYAVGAAGAIAGAGGDTWFNGASLGASSVGAKGGTGGASGTAHPTNGAGAGGTGGASGSGVGTTKYSGGDGGAGQAGGASGGGGGAGGGAAGPNGAGKAGATTASSAQGRGGGAANNGSVGSNSTGGNGRGSTGGGATGNPGADGTAGTGGGGGGATGANTSVANLTGGKGAQDTIWTSTDIFSTGVAVLPFQTADAARTKGRLLLEIDPVEAVTLGTDVTVKITCDGGSNKATASTLTNLGKGQSGRTVVETEEVTCTSGTSFSAEIGNPNGKNFNIYKAVLEVAP